MSLASSPTGGFSAAHVASQQRPITAADLALFPCTLPSGDIDYELDHGRLRIMVPPGCEHAFVQARISFQLMLQAKLSVHGDVLTEVGVVLSRNPDTIFGADVAFIGKAKRPIRQSKEGYLETIPDLVVEVRSKNDTIAELERKATVYLEAGVGAVWLADPDAKTLTIHRANAEPFVYRAADTMISDDPIPAFQLRLADIFA